MRLLIDTQAFLWFTGNDPKLSTAARSLIEDPSNDLLLSAASVWELPIISIDAVLDAYGVVRYW